MLESIYDGITPRTCMWAGVEKVLQDWLCEYFPEFGIITNFDEAVVLIDKTDSEPYKVRVIRVISYTLIIHVLEEPQPNRKTAIERCYEIVEEGAA